MSDDCAIKIDDVTKSFTISVNSSKNGKKQNKTQKKTITILKNVSIDIKKGEILGIIGRNGSGKSTLLSLIAKIMNPDSGSITVNGKIASILELGMGFHPDMTGRENIYLKGKLYGFSKKQIDSIIDEIIAYTEIEEYIDNPLRTYSTGMTSRLAFSILVHVNAEIMLVDEVLSVGDAAFVAKASNHFRTMAKSGRTIVFVSHSITELESICNRVIWIDNGLIYREGNPKSVCSEYMIAMSESPNIIKELAKSGVAEGQYKLSHFYRDGINVQKNNDEYKLWLKKASDQGHTKAQVEYGELLLSTGDKEEASVLFQSASNKGDQRAKTNLALLKTNYDQIDVLKKIYEHNISTNGITEYKLAELLIKIAREESDYKNAYELMVKSSEKGYAPALHNIALMYRDGVGTTKDTNKMEATLNISSNKGNISSTLYLADLYSSGNIIPLNEKKAFELYQKMARQGNSNAIFKVANSYLHGIGIDKDTKKADYWYDKYTQSLIINHYLWAQYYSKSKEEELQYEKIIDDLSEILPPSTLNSLIISHLGNEKEGKYLSLLKSNAESGNLDAMRRLGNLYYDGVSVPRDPSKALEWYEKCAAVGDGWSMVRCGEIHRDGKGTVMDAVRASAYFRDAAVQGNAAAAWNMILMSASGCVGREVFEDALSLLEGMAATGNLDAMRRLGNLYYDGVSVPRDPSKALEWYEKCAAVGDGWSMVRCDSIRKEANKTKSVEKNNTLYRCIIIEGSDYNLYLNHVLLQKYMGKLEIIGIVSKYKSNKSIDGFPTISSSEINKTNFDYAIVMDIDHYSTIVDDISIELAIDKDKLIGISPFREPNFDFLDYVKIKESKVSIIASNCFGGLAYKFLSLPHTSPFINLSVRVKDMIKLIKNSSHYLSVPLTCGLKCGEYPTGKLDDITIIFNHEKEYGEAENKWMRKKNRLNYHNIAYIMFFVYENEDFHSLINYACDNPSINITICTQFNPHEYLNKCIASNSRNAEIVKRVHYIFEYEHELLNYTGFWNIHNCSAKYESNGSSSIKVTKMLLNGDGRRRNSTQECVVDLPVLKSFRNTPSGMKDYEWYKFINDLPSDKDIKNYLTPPIIEYINQLYDKLIKENTKKSASIATTIITKTAEFGNPDSLGRLGRAYRDGIGVEKDVNRAIELMDMAISNGCQWITIECYRLHKNRNTEEDLKKASIILSREVGRGNSNAINIYCDELMKDNNEKSLSEAIQMLNTLANKGNPDSLGRLGRAYRDGIGVEKDVNRAIELMDMAISNGCQWIINERNSLKNRFVE